MNAVDFLTLATVSGVSDGGTGPVASTTSGLLPGTGSSGATFFATLLESNFAGCVADIRLFRDLVDDLRLKLRRDGDLDVVGVGPAHAPENHAADEQESRETAAAGDAQPEESVRAGRLLRLRLRLRRHRWRLLLGAARGFSSSSSSSSGSGSGRRFLLAKGTAPVRAHRRRSRNRRRPRRIRRHRAVPAAESVRAAPSCSSGVGGGFGGGQRRCRRRSRRRPRRRRRHRAAPAAARARDVSCSSGSGAGFSAARRCRRRSRRRPGRGPARARAQAWLGDFGFGLAGVGGAFGAFDMKANSFASAGGGAAGVGAAADGTCSRVLHLGQATDLPARPGGTCNFAAQEGQASVFIGLGSEATLRPRHDSRRERGGRRGISNETGNRRSCRRALSPTYHSIPEAPRPTSPSSSSSGGTSESFGAL